MNYKMYMSVRFNHGALAPTMKSLRPYWDNLVILDCTKGESLSYPVEMIVPPSSGGSISPLINFVFDDAIKRNIDVLFLVVSDFLVCPGVIEDMYRMEGCDIWGKEGWLTAIRTDVVRKTRFDEGFFFYCSDVDWRRRCLEEGFRVKKCLCGTQRPVMSRLSPLVGEETGDCCKFRDFDCGVKHIGTTHGGQTWGLLSPEERVVFESHKESDYEYYRKKWGAW
jgi:hypothetical protein